MAVLAAPILPTSPTEPNLGAAVIIAVLMPHKIVLTAPLIPAPNFQQLIPATNGYAL